MKGKLSEKDSKEIEEKNNELKELLKPETKDAIKIKQKLDELNKIVQKASTELYRQAQEQYSQEHAGQNSTEKNEGSNPKKKKKGNDGDNVVDADFKVEDGK